MREVCRRPAPARLHHYDTGLKTYDMRARIYRPDVGRFLTQDRYEAAASDLNLQVDPLTQDRYAFAGGNPVSNVEFDGHHIRRPSPGNSKKDRRSMRGRSFGNGCGPKGYGALVPDGIFHRACDQHDRCYGTIGNSKGGCDRFFYRRMREACEGSGFRNGPAGLAPCKTEAKVYYKAVKNRAGNAYKNAQKEAGVQCAGGPDCPPNPGVPGPVNARQKLGAHDAKSSSPQEARRLGRRLAALRKFGRLGRFPRKTQGVPRGAEYWGESQGTVRASL